MENCNTHARQAVWPQARRRERKRRFQPRRSASSRLSKKKNQQGNHVSFPHFPPPWVGVRPRCIGANQKKKSTRRYLSAAFATPRGETKPFPKSPALPVSCVTPLKFSLTTPPLQALPPTMRGSGYSEFPWSHVSLNTITFSFCPRRISCTTVAFEVLSDVPDSSPPAHVCTGGWAALPERQTRCRSNNKRNEPPRPSRCRFLACGHASHRSRISPRSPAIYSSPHLFPTDLCGTGRSTFSSAVFRERK